MGVIGNREGEMCCRCLHFEIIIYVIHTITGNEQLNSVILCQFL
jgi:hypothetical protein